MNGSAPAWLARLAAAKGTLGKEQWSLLGAAAITALVLVQGILPGLNRWRNEAGEQLLQQRQIVSILEGELRTIGEDDPVKVRARIQREHETLLASVAEHEQAVKRLRGGLVDSGQITTLLARLLEQSQGVRLVSLESAGVTPVSAGSVAAAAAAPGTPPANPAAQSGGGGKVGSADTAAAQASPAAAQAPTAAAQAPQVPVPILYRHGVRLVLRGDYRSLVRYLARVEQLPWTIYWDEVSLTVDKHPVVEVGIEFHTLSEQEEWLQIT